MPTFVGRLVAVGALVALAAGGATWSSGGAPAPSAGPGPVQAAALAAWSTGDRVHPHLGAHPRLRRLVCHLARSEAVVVTASGTRTLALLHGAVRAADGGELLLELLDGRTAAIPLAGWARVFRNGVRADPAELEPGDMAFALSLDGTGRAVRAFDPAHDPCRGATEEGGPPTGA